MKVLLVTPSVTDIEKFKGIVRVSQMLAKHLSEKVELEIYEIYKKKRMYSKLNTLTTVVLKELMSDADIIHAVVPEGGAVFPLIKYLKSAKTVTTFHDLFPILYSERLKYRFKTFAKTYTNIVWRASTRANIVTSISQKTAREVEKVFGRRVDYVINPGVEERFIPLNIKKEKPTLGFFANFSYRKGVDLAIEVFKLVKKRIDAKLILAGGYLEAVYQRQFNVEKMVEGLSDVEILGAVSDEKLVELYNSFDVFLFTSRMEGFGIPILEAQRCGIPTLVFSWADIPEETKKEAIQCESIEDMANKVVELLENQSYYQEVRKRGMDYAKNFTWQDFANKYLEIYESLARR